MPKEQEEFQNAVEEILQAVIFENWLRFYFLVEEKPENGSEEGALRLELPEKALKKIGELYPDLLPLADSLNGRQVDFESSRHAVLKFVLDFLDGKRLGRGMAQTVLESAAFEVRVNMFHTWVQLHENQLDQSFLDFGAWRKLFEEWARTPAARELGARLAQSLGGNKSQK